MNYSEFEKKIIKLKKTLDIDLLFVYNATPFKQ